MLLGISLLLSSSLFATEIKKPLPLWEIGAGFLPFRTDNYRGSPQHKWFGLPIPAFTIRGKNIEGENGFVRGHLARFGDFTFDISVSVGLNVSAGGDRLRSGMDDLDPTFEVGPMLRYYMWKSKSGNQFLNLEIPFRSVYATDLTYIDHVGYYSIPYLNYLTKPMPQTLGFSTETSIGIQYGSSGFHNRFYAVDTKFATAEREKFHSVAGYSGVQLAVSLAKRMGDVLFIPFFRYDYLDGAVYNKSPLYKNAHYTFFGAAFIWYFAGSDKKQEAPTMVK